MRKINTMIALAALTFISCGVREIDLAPPVTFRLAVTASEDHPLVSALVDFSRLCSERSHGTLTVTVIHSGKMGGEALVLSRLQRGDIDLACGSSSALSALSPDYAAFSLPVTFRDTSHYQRVMDGEIGRKALSSLESRGLIGLGHFDTGALYFISRSALLKAPTDFMGKRTASLPGPSGSAFVRALGASPLSLPEDAGYPALRSGLVDIAAVDLHTVTREKRPLSDLSLLQFPVIHYPAVLVASKMTLDRLPPEAREFLMHTSREAALSSRRTLEGIEKETFLSLRSAGMRITEPGNKSFFTEKAGTVNTRLDKDIAMILKEIQKQ